jgi:hypothetical protein
MYHGDIGVADFIYDIQIIFKMQSKLLFFLGNMICLIIFSHIYIHLLLKSSS